VKAIWQGVVLAESDDTVVVEGNHYFPEQSLNREFFRESSHHSLCPWKGIASYYTVEVDGEHNENAAWYYQKPSLLARKVEGRVAFWRGVRIIEGHRRWQRYEDLDLDSCDFEALGADFERDTDEVTCGRVGLAECRVMPLKRAVDYAVGWIEEHRE
jgi:uncharacterized protein (DUF427 family)